MLALVPLFGWLCQRLPRARLLPAVYAFFALNLLAFVFALDARVFFVWLSVFNLFVVSVFWSYMSDPSTAARRRASTAPSPPAAAAVRSPDRCSPRVSSAPSAPPVCFCCPHYCQ